MKYIFLLCFLLLFFYNSYSQDHRLYRFKIKDTEKTRSKTLIVVSDQISEEKLENLFKAHWNVGMYNVVSKDEIIRNFDLYNNDSYYFLIYQFNTFFISGKIKENGTCFLDNEHLDEQRYKLYDFYAVCPAGITGFTYTTEIKFLNEFVNGAILNGVGKQIKKFHTPDSIIKNKILLIHKMDGYDEEKIKEAYPYKYKLIKTEKDYKEVYSGNLDHYVLLSSVVSPAGHDAGGVSYNVVATDLRTEKVLWYHPARTMDDKFFHLNLNLLAKLLK